MQNGLSGLMSITVTLSTLGASDFFDFLFSYFIELMI